MRLCFFLLLSVSVFPLLGICNIVPASLHEAEIALENGEIDSLCFIHYRSLLLQPVKPLLEGWRAIQELSYEFDGQRFPTVNEMKEILTYGDSSDIFTLYPWLRSFEALFTLEQIEAEYPLSGIVSADLTAGLTSGGTAGNLKSVIRSRLCNAELSFSENSFSEHNDYADLHRRKFTFADPEGSYKFSLGNFSLPKRSLLWGKFHKNDSVSNKWLLGNLAEWNGVCGSFLRGVTELKGIYHVRDEEQLTGLFADFKLVNLVLGAGTVVQKRDRDELLIAFNIEDPDRRYMIEFAADLEGGISGQIRGVLSSPILFCEGELWYMNHRYNPEMSDKCTVLRERYKRYDEAVIGIVSRFRYDGTLGIILTRFNGELLSDAGRGELTIILKRIKPLEISLKNRFLQSSFNSNDNLIFEEAFSMVPVISSFSFPFITSTLLEQGLWQRSSISGGASFTHEVNVIDLSAWCRWYRDHSEISGIRLAVKQRIGKKSGSSLMLTLPFSESKEMEIYGKVEFVF